MWFTDTDIKRNHSLILLIAVDYYSNSELFTHVNNKMIILIFFTTHEWENFKDSCFHHQFSIVLIFIIIIHKCQNLTLNRIILNISRKNHMSELAYITISWVKKLSDLLFKKRFDKKHFEFLVAVNNQTLAW